MEDWNTWPADPHQADRQSMYLLGGLAVAGVVGVYLWKRRSHPTITMPASALAPELIPVTAAAAAATVTNPVEGAPSAPGAPAGPSGAEGIGNPGYLNGLAVDGSIAQRYQLGTVEPRPVQEVGFLGGAVKALFMLCGPVAIGWSYSTYKSVPWALAAGLVGPPYVAYRAFQKFGHN